jgi:GTPase SAR1 family protein
LNSWETFLIVEVSRHYGLSQKEQAILLAKFPDENTVITNKQLADRAIEDDQLPSDAETVRRQLWTIYNERFCPKENREYFPGYDQKGSSAKDGAFLVWLKQKYLNWLPTLGSNIIVDAPSHAFSSNPFVPLAEAVDNPQLFFDREREIRRIFEVLNSGSSVALIGEEGIGKSSMLWEICRRAESRLQSPRQPVFLDLNWVRDEDDFYRALCNEIGIPQSDGYMLTRNLRTQKVLLAIDNVGKLAWKGFTRQVRDHLRGLASKSDDPLKLILAASEPLSTLFNDSQDEGKTSPLASICQEENLKPWDEPTIRAFIEARLAMTSVRFTEEEIIQLVQESGGHPRQLMQLCYRTYSRKVEGGE